MRIPALLTLLFLFACSVEAPVEIALTGHTMGTQYNVKLRQQELDHSLLQQEIDSSLELVEQMMSTYRPGSEISRFNQSATTDWHGVSAAFCESVEQALLLSSLTEGAFDITVAPLVNLWGFGPDDMIDEPPTDAEISALMDTIGYEHLHADCSLPALRKDIAELMLDMSAFGKGLAVDYLADLLSARGIENYLVEVGGEMRLRGKNAKGEKWAIGIEMPVTDQRRPHTIVHLTDTALATSGDYRNFFEKDGQRYSHTIDTRTGRPVTHSLASVTVVNGSGSRADALATALLVMGPEKGMELATRENLAVLFLLRDDAGIDERATPAFERLRSSG
jgi:thiamine biosynthesis lipoprotein